MAHQKTQYPTDDWIMRKVYLQSSHQKQTTSWNVSYPSLHSNDILNCNQSPIGQHHTEGIVKHSSKDCWHKLLKDTHTHTYTHNTHTHTLSLTLTHSCFPYYNYIVLKIDTDFFSHEKRYQNSLLKDDSAFTRISTSQLASTRQWG